MQPAVNDPCMQRRSEVGAKNNRFMTHLLLPHILMTTARIAFLK